MSHKQQRKELNLLLIASWLADSFNALDRAECVIKTIIHGDRRTARASLYQVKSAAAALSLQCAAGGQSQGGIATNIGQSNRSYVPGSNSIMLTMYKHPVLIKKLNTAPRRRQQPRRYSQHIQANHPLRQRRSLHPRNFLRRCHGGHAGLDGETPIWSR